METQTTPSTEPPSAKLREQWKRGIVAANEKDEQFWDGPALRLIAQVDALVAALTRTARWHLADGSLCWCAHNDLAPDDEHHLSACKQARVVIAKARKL